MICVLKIKILQLEEDNMFHNIEDDIELVLL